MAKAVIGGGLPLKLEAGWHVHTHVHTLVHTHVTLKAVSFYITCPVLHSDVL